MSAGELRGIYVRRCAACGGTGRRLNPMERRRVRLRKPRNWTRMCDACGGTGREPLVIEPEPGR